MNGREIKRVDAALIVYSQHRFHAGPQQCACGARFPATLQGVHDHKRHRMEEALKAADAE